MNAIVKKTLCAKAGFIVGKSYRLDTEAKGYPVGTIVKMVRDDKDDYPKMEFPNGYIHYVRIESIDNTPLTEIELSIESFVVGDKYKVIDEKGHGFFIGDIVTCRDKGDGRSYIAFKKETLQQLLSPDQVEKYVEPAKTPAEAAGLVIGKTYVVVEKGNFDKGDIVEFTRDDGSTMPFFKDVVKGEEMCTTVHKIGAETEYKAKTPVEEKGMVVGGKYIVAGASSFELGEVVELVMDDSTRCVLFKRADGSTRYENVDYIGEAYVAPNVEINTMSHDAATSMMFSVKLTDDQITRISAIASEFSPSIRGRLGLSSYCRSCQSKRVVNSEVYKAGRNREQTRKYREVHRERYLAAHRITQFNRKSKIKAQSDGSLTDEILKSIYNKDTCYWCSKFVDIGQRTLEHIIELCSGGLHGISNVDMACKPCNSARKGKQNGKD